MQKKRVHLVCNAHLDPVWLWHWEDGLTEALSTYRVAADFCEKNDGFIFNVLRSPAYSSFNINPDDEKLNNRFAPRQDQGEHEVSYIVRLQDTLGRAREVILRVKPYKAAIKIKMGKYGLATLAVKRNAKRLSWREVNLVEQKV